MTNVELEGLAYLCFFDDGSWFQVEFVSILLFCGVFLLVNGFLYSIDRNGSSQSPLGLFEIDETRLR